MTYKSYKKGGFSLIELIVYFSIFGIAAGLGATVLNFALEGRGAVRRMNDVHVNTQRVMEQMIDRVRVAQYVDDASSTLRLVMTASSTSPTVFSLSSGVVRIQEGAGAVTDITPGVVYITDLSFTKVTNPAPATSTVSISITGAYQEDGVARPGTEYTLQTVAMPLR